MDPKKNEQLATTAALQLYDRAEPQAQCEFWITMCDGVHEGGVLEIPKDSAARLRTLLDAAWDAFNAAEDL